MPGGNAMMYRDSDCELTIRDHGGRALIRHEDRSGTFAKWQQ